MKNRLGAILMLCGIILAASAVPIIFHNRDEAVSAANSVSVALPQVKEMISTTGSAENPSTVSRQTDTSRTSALTYSDEYLGILAIPSLSLELPILNEWSEAALKTAPCRQQGAVATDDLVIAGHNYTGHFGKLDSLCSGDKLTLTLLNGDSFTYTVEEITTLSPTAVDDVLSGAFSMTLYTCSYSGQKRIVVRCSRLSE